MKLYNRTKIPDEIVQSILAAAGRMAGARTSKVVVQVNPARGFGCRGMAYGCQWVKMRGKNVSHAGRTVITDGGYFTITLPRCGPLGTKFVWSTDQAQAFFRTAVHEWVHIRDYQRDPAGRNLDWDRPGHGRRRMKHDARPEEHRANCATFDVIYNQSGYEKAYEEIVALAMAMEEMCSTI